MTVFLLPTSLWSGFCVFQVIIGELYGDISHVGACTLANRYKYIGFFKYSKLVSIAKKTLTDGL
jgi:hypothetical protein